LTTGRLDAEYYQPKYEEIINKIKTYKNGFSSLREFIDSYSTGYPYKSESYIESNGIPLVRINNITERGLDLSNVIHIPKEDLNLSTKDIARENDILISMSGTIGLSCVVRVKNSIVINQRIMRISSKNYNSNVLSMLINSIVGKYQLERIGTGGVQTNISSTDIKNIIIPIIDNEVQRRIAALVEKSFALHAESEQLLNEAKAVVESEIERL
jgi:type I restriction enzyme S subunit